ncbi:MAG: polyprenyl synthetase family protein [Woeseiaceae bacterium]|nr:polyprenyl synthetase family protein [Woeseiaceae bacterium]
MTTGFNDRLDAYIERVNRKLDACLPSGDEMPQRLHEAMRYAVFNGGKRIRPLLVYATGEIVAVDGAQLDAPAAAIELLHTFSLVHDDLPAMDDDDLRRGKPTLHVAFDEATAILAADALQPLAFAVLADTDDVGGDTRARLVRLLADACGSIGMTGGQSIDLAAEGKTLTVSELEHMYALKTGALIHASVMSACLLKPVRDDDLMQALDGFARAIGVAFQIRDDMLDVEGSTETIGKPAGSDAGRRKATYPSLFGADASRARCDELVQQADACLADIGQRAAPLRWLARYIIDRVS